MDELRFIQWSFAATGLLFIFAFGCVCGSFINVLVYRLPKGLNVVTPPSACPHCDTRLTWRENLPVIGWLLLRGRCRFCKSRISPEYPLVEFFVGALFSIIWILWFMKPSLALLVGLNPDAWRPDFAFDGIARAWPMLLIVFALAGSFVAATLIDARTFTIPLALPWFVIVVALAVHPLHAWWIASVGGLRASAHQWTIPVVSGPWLGAALGGALGILISNILLRARVLPLSFADYPQWEAQALAKQEAHAQAAAAAGQSADAHNSGLGPALLRTLFLTGPAVTLMVGGMAIGLPTGRGGAYAAIGAAVGLLIGLVLRRLAPSGSADDRSAADEDPIWVQYPHTRREILKEMLFLAPCLALGGLGSFLASSAGPLGHAAQAAPLPVLALGGSLLGFLVGGGLVWFFRIGGSMLLGKEAMGLGDVHLMAAAGAALGWIDPTLAFFTAPFMGIMWAVLSVFFRQFFHRQGTALPYGPHLAAATLLVLILKPLYESGLSRLAGGPIDIP